MFYAKLIKAIKENWHQLKYYVLFFVALYVFYSIMSLLKVSAVFTYTVIALAVVAGFILVVRHSKQMVEDRKTAASYKDLIGKRGLAIEEINGKNGKITIDGDEYSAYSDDGKTLPEYADVIVVSTDGLRLVVSEHKTDVSNQSK